jgi:formiminotetrahydrofolate cyclodeaminase
LATSSYSAMVLEDLLDAFSSNDPYPGGGSAAALAGALGVSLLLMAAGITRTRTGAPEEAADLAEAAAALRPVRDALSALVDADSEAYQAVLTAMRLPKRTDDEVSAREESIQAAMRGATETPLDTMRACQGALQRAVVVASSASPNASSDVAVGIELLMAAVRGAGLNVDTNLDALQDAPFVQRARVERQDLEAASQRDAQQAKQRLTSRGIPPRRRTSS